MPNGNGRPGLLRMAGSYLRAPLERAWEREAHARHTALSYEIGIDALEQVVRRVKEDDDGFIPIGALDRELASQDQEVLRTRARRAAVSPLLTGYLGNLRHFVMGEGPKLLAATDDENRNEAIDGWWRKFQRANRWEWLEDELPDRLWTDGEFFVRRFAQAPEMVASAKALERLRQLGVTDKMLRAERDAPDGMIFVRIVLPENIADPRGGDAISHGIVTAESDVDTVLGYLFAPGGALDKSPTFVPAEDMLHAKIRAGAGVKRGRSLLEPLLRRNKQYDDWLTSRIALNRARSAIALVKTIDAPAATVTKIRDAQATEKRPSIEGDTRRIKALRDATTIHKGPGITYEYLTPNLQAQDVRHDGRSILLNMAAAAGMPEFMFTGDASNANFSSTLVAEGPAMRQFKYWRKLLEAPFGQLWKWAVVAGAEADAIEGLSADKAKELAPSFDWPEIKVREELEHTKANHLRHLAGVQSKETWARDEGLDWDAEVQRIAAEREEDFDFLGLPGAEG